MKRSNVAKSIPTRNDLSGEIRSKVAVILNQHLADLSDLYSQTKFAHWNVKGMQFIAVHKLFDELAEEVEGYIDEVAERITGLGYVAEGTVRQVAEASSLNEFPVESNAAPEVLESLAERYAAVGKTVREDIDTTDELGDKVTADLLTGIAAGLDKALYFLESHIQ